MKKVHCLEERFKRPKGLVYPIEAVKDRPCRLIFYIEENGEGGTDQEYEMYAMKLSEEGFKYFTIPLKKAGRFLFKLKYENMEIAFRATKTHKRYAGSLPGPKVSLRKLLNKVGNTPHDLFIKHKVVLLGHAEKPETECEDI